MYMRLFILFITSGFDCICEFEQKHPKPAKKAQKNTYRILRKNIVQKNM